MNIRVKIIHLLAFGTVVTALVIGTIVMLHPRCAADDMIVPFKSGDIGGEFDFFCIYMDCEIRVWRVRVGGKGPWIMKSGQASGWLFVDHVRSGTTTRLPAEQTSGQYEPQVYRVTNGEVLIACQEITLSQDMGTGLANLTIYHVLGTRTQAVYRQSFVAVAQQKGVILSQWFDFCAGLDGTPVLLNVVQKWTRGPDGNWQPELSGGVNAVWYADDEEFVPLPPSEQTHSVPSTRSAEAE